MKSWCSATAIVLAIWCGPLTTQSIQAEDEPIGHLEIPTDSPLPPPAQNTDALRGGRSAVSRNGFVSVQVNVDDRGYNIIGDAANEPTIAVDPNDRTRMAIGWRQFDNIGSSYRQAGWAYSHDAGTTWTFPGSIQPGVFRSDPVLDADTQGNFFYNSLTADDAMTSAYNFRCRVFKSSNGGISWNYGTYAYGGDKQWQAIDLTDGIGRDNIYAYWTRAYSCIGCNGHFTRSYNGGSSFMQPVDVPGNPFWGTLAVGPDGELYIAGEGFTVTKSSTVKNPSSSVSWDFTRTVDLDGVISSSGGPNPGGLLGQTWVAVDHSDGPSRGNVYLLCSVSRQSAPDPLDVMFARSTDGGYTWSTPIRVNDDPQDNGAYQWFGTMSVAPNGRIDVVWNDTRNYPGSYRSELYYAYSIDGGQSFTTNQVLTPSFDPHVGWPQQNKMGDYYDMVSDNGGANLAYAATFYGGQDVFFLRIHSYDCNTNGIVDVDELAANPDLDCQQDGILDECQLPGRDCNQNGILDECDLADETSADCNDNQIPDECELDSNDCNNSGVPDDCDVFFNYSEDCNGNVIPDECELVGNDCNDNLVPDECDLVGVIQNTSLPRDEDACTNGTATFLVAAAGDDLDYQWYKENQPLFDDQYTSGANGPALTLEELTLDDIGSYHCRVTLDGCLHVDSRSASLALAVRPRITAYSGASIVCDNGSVVLSVTHDGLGVVGYDYLWLKDGQPIPHQPNSRVLNLRSVAPADEGTYTCVVSNDRCGFSEESPGMPVVVIGATFTQQPAPQCRDTDDTAVFSMAVDQSKSDKAVTGYRWQRWIYVDSLDRWLWLDVATPSLPPIEPLVIANPTEDGLYRGGAYVNDACWSYTREVQLTVGSRTGDLDGDSDVDLADMALMLDCVGETVADSPQCSCADFDQTGEVIDQLDWNGFEAAVTGP